MDVVVVGVVEGVGRTAERVGAADVVGPAAAAARTYAVTRLCGVAASTTASPFTCHVSKALPRGWSLGRDVPNAASGWPDRTTEALIEKLDERVSIALSTESWT